VRPTANWRLLPIYGNCGVGKPGTDGRNIVVVDIGLAEV